MLLCMSVVSNVARRPHTTADPGPSGRPDPLGRDERGVVIAFRDARQPGNDLAPVVTAVVACPPHPSPSRHLENAYYIPGLWWARSVVHWAKVKNYVAPPNHYSNHKLQDVWLMQD